MYIYVYAFERNRSFEFQYCFSLLKEIKDLFQVFDKDGNGTIDFDEFLVKLRVSYSSRVKPPNKRHVGDNCTVPDVLNYTRLLIKAKQL